MILIGLQSFAWGFVYGLGLGYLSIIIINEVFDLG